MADSAPWPAAALRAGMDLLAAGEPVAALVPLRSALAERVAHGTPEQVGQCWYWLGNALAEQDQDDAAGRAFADALALLDPTTAPEMVADAAESAAMLGRPAAAVEPLRAALDRLAELGEVASVANFQHSLGLVLLDLDDAAGAVRAFRAAAVAFRGIDRSTDAAEALICAAETAIELEPADQVLADATEASILFAAAGQSVRADQCWSLIGVARAALGDDDGALVAFERAAGGHAAAGEHDLAARCLHEMLSIHWSAGRLAEVADIMARRRDAVAATGDEAATAEETVALSVAYYGAGRAAEAEAELERARRYYLGVGDVVAAARCDLRIADLHTLFRSAAAAEPTVRRCLAVFESAGATDGRIDSLNQLGDIQLMRGDVDSARCSFERALKLALGESVQSGGAEPGGERVADCYRNLGGLRVMESRADAAIEQLARAKEIYRRLDIGHKEAECRVIAASAFQLIGDFGEAERELTAARNYYEHHGGMAAISPVVDISMATVLAAAGRPNSAAATTRPPLPEPARRRRDSAPPVSILMRRLWPSIRE